MRQLKAVVLLAAKCGKEKGRTPISDTGCNSVLE
jgi:hypothetical protein